MDSQEETANYLGLSDRVVRLSRQAESGLKEQFDQVDQIAFYNSQKVLSAFQKQRVAEGCFAGTTGYGYDDRGREVLEAVYADIFHTEDALVRIGFVNGTHAIATALFGVLRPGDVLLSATGTPYDTLLGVIGIQGGGNGSLMDFGISYRQAELTDSGEPNLGEIAKAASDPQIKAILVSRSRGYTQRPSLSVSQIGDICALIKRVNPKAYILVDNCYGEFVEPREPTDVG
ncbi:MAG: methionine gamma-lyase family protein, partial [Oscillospiraceae bacterium]|nr:methionine gamma-lyase family protein [Oscillospiraceae bacterium]